MSEAYESVLNHLLFHKSLISEKDGAERINRYLAMLKDIDQGMYIAVADPFDKGIAAAFELVLENQMDPWDIDLIQFTRMYLKRVKREGGVNFVTAGKLIFMAWSILKMQSDEVLLSAEPPKNEETFFSDWDVGFEFYRDPEDLDYTEKVLSGHSLPLQEAIRREGHRAVTLMELMKAFDEGRKEAELRMQLNALREKAIMMRSTDFHEKVHGEDISDDLRLTWSRILDFNGTSIPLGSLCYGDRWDTITVFVSLLYLAKMNKIEIKQKALPFGEIYVRKTAPEETLTVEEIRAEIESEEAERAREVVA